MGDPDRRPLVVRDLVVTYGGGARVVDGLSFEVEPGEVHGLVGESGCGKSTVAQAILRILPRSARVTAVELRVDGDDVPGLDARRLRSFRWRKASLALQSAMNALNPVMRIGGQIADAIAAHEPATSGARRDRRVAELLERVGIAADRRRAYPHELSGGMRQRVVIAMALALRPPLVILDEPTTALDVVVQREILTELLALRDELGFAMLFITHDLSLLFEIAARITVVRDGRAVESAPAAELLRSPRHEYTRHLIASFPSLRGPRAPGVDSEPAAAPAAVPVPAVVPAERPILEVRSLSAGYDEGGALGWRSRRRRVLEDVSFSLRRGEILALAGESGSGKSTIAGVIARLVPATSGEILLDGRDVLRAEPRRASAAYRRRVQMIFQDPYGSLNPAHTIGHHLERPLRRHAIVPSRDVGDEIVALLEAVGLTPGRSFVDRRPDRLSGGQRQRVAIARALAARPDVILADEPTSMLDVSIRLGILNLMRRLRDERGVSFLHITHDLASARYVADRIAILHAGRIVESGPADRLLASPSHPYTRRLVAAVPDPWARADVPTEEQRCEA